MIFRWLIIAAGVLSVLRAEPSATRLTHHLAEAVAGDDAADDVPQAVPATENAEAAEMIRLEGLPAVAIPIQDETLAGAITTIATTSGMNFIAPATEQFAERVTLTTKVNPWRLLNRLGERYGFAMRFRDGIWEFNRDEPMTLVARVYSLKHTNLDLYKTSQNAFSSVAGGVATAGEASTQAEGGLVFSAQTQKIIDDIRELIGLKAGNRVAREVKSDGTGSAEPLPTGREANVLYLADANALYVTCTRLQHDVVEGYIKLVDQPARQLRIEARFFETSWDPRSVLGINPQNLQPKVALRDIETNVDLSRWSGDGMRALLTVDDVSLQINALQSDRKSRLVQNPTVVTANNREVYFSVGDEEPFVSSNNIYSGVANGGFGSTMASVSIRRIGTSVNVLPTIFDGDNGGKRRIRLVVRIEVGALKEFRQINSIAVPVVTSQKYEYTTYVDEGQVLAFGGLSGLGETDGVTKVPLAGDVPVVGYLFKSKSREVHQRNLVAYIVARVVDSGEQVALPPVALNGAPAPKPIVFRR